MEVSDILSLLGSKASDPAVASLLRALKVARAPQVARSDADGHAIIDPRDWVGNRHLGIELGFEDEGVFLGLHPDDQGSGEMLFTRLCLYGDHPEMAPFAGRLPFGLDLSDGRPAVRAKLAASETTRRSWTLDTWELARHRLTVGYGGRGSHISLMHFSCHRPRQRADGEDAQLARAIQKLLALIGTPLSDPALQQLLSVTGLAREIEDQNGMLVVDQSERIGLELQFRNLGGGRDPVLAQAILFSDANTDTVRWPGALPFGLDFDDSPERMFARMAEAPAALLQPDDSSFSVYAVWHFAGFTLVVEFSRMENLILAVQLLAPGAWVE